MDLFGMDRKLSELGETDLNDILDQEVFTPPPSVSIVAGFNSVPPILGLTYFFRVLLSSN